MIFKLELFVLFCLINFHVISSNVEPELVHLLNSDYLLVNEYGIFQFKGNNFNQYEKILSLREEQNPSVHMKNIQNFYNFKCFGDNICIFINNYIYIFSSDGKLIKKTIILVETSLVKYVVIPFNTELKDINTFNYILLFVNKENNLIVHFYSYKNNLEKNVLFSKRKITLYEYKKSFRSQIENNIQCKLISNSLFCFFSKTLKFINIFSIFHFN